MHLAPNTTLQQRYRIVRLLARGGMGAVYEASDERLGSTVALKQTLVSDPQLRQAFEREARLLAQLQHPALPLVSDHFAEGDGEFLVMQFIPGVDLEQALQQRARPFRVDEVLDWADNLLDALDYLHSQTPPIIHRDIKPQNLKLNARGSVVLLDFGLAKGGDAQTSQSVFGYTPQYAPLEQVKGSGTDARSDLYALAATLYRLLTNQMPPDALTRAAALINGQPDPLRPPSQLNPLVPDALDDLLMQALAQRAKYRPPNAQAMRTALRDLRQSAQLPNSSGQTTVVIGQTIAPPQTPSTATAATSTVPLQPPPPPSSITLQGLNRPNARSRRPIVLGCLGLLLLVLLGGALGRGILANREPVISAPAVTTSRSAPLPSGSVARTADWDVEVVEMLRGDEAYRQLYRANNNNERPPEGMEYLLMRVAVTPRGGSDSFHFGDIDLVGERAVVYDASAAVTPEPRLMDSTPIDRGQRADRWAAFLVGQEEQNLILRIDTSYEADPVFLAVDDGAQLNLDPALVDIVPTKLGNTAAEPAQRSDLVITEDWELTLEETLRGEAAWQRILEENQFNDAAPAGMEYVLARFSGRFIADVDTVDLMNHYYFTVVGSSGVEVEQATVTLDTLNLQAELYPSGQFDGWVALTVPQGDADARVVFKGTSSALDADGFNTRYFAIGE
jgi:serine/threonine protein kinase